MTYILILYVYLFTTIASISSTEVLCSQFLVSREYQLGPNRNLKKYYLDLNRFAQDREYYQKGLDHFSRFTHVFGKGG